MNQQQTQTFGWPIVIIFLILFWPIGIFLLLVKLSRDRSAQFGGGGAILKFIGFLLMAFGVLMLIGSIAIEDTGMGFFLLALFGLPGLWLFRRANTQKKQGLKYRRYIDLIVNREVRDVPALAQATGYSQQQVVTDVNHMISHGMLGRARLNLEIGRVQFPVQRPQPRPQPRPQQPQTYRPQPSQNQPNRPTAQARPQAPQPQFKQFEPRTIRCKACSANNFVEQLPAQCEYCGSSLHE